MIKLTIYVKGIGKVAETDARDHIDARNRCQDIAREGYFIWRGENRRSGTYIPPYQIAEITMEAL